MPDTVLDAYRLLDLTDHKGFLCGRILGDLGADVLKVEPPGGDPSRMIGPFCHDIQDPDKSLYWQAYNASKRGITLNIEAPRGVELFKSLVQSADIVVESFPPGYIDGVGIGYDVLSRVNPGIILTSITAFGQEGPWRHRKESDISLWALSSYMYVTGDKDRPPVRPSFPQSYLHAGLEAAASTLVALYYRQLSGEGQHIDVSVQEALAIVNLQNQQYWDLARFNPTRAGSSQHLAGVRWTHQRRLWRCRDGYIVFLLFSGHLGVAGNSALTQWMDSEGLAPECMKSIDWSSFDPQGQELSDADYGRMMDALRMFFLRHTKAELYDRAVQERISLYPCNTVEDLGNDAQLKARGFWVTLEHPELGAVLRFPGPCMTFSESSCGVASRAPFVGEHNVETYQGEMGLSGEEMADLKREGVI